MTAQRTIEVCSNNEWLNVFGPLSDLGNGTIYQDEAGNAWFSEVCRRLESELGVATEVARGQRRLCHGWHGANTFARKGSGLGTFAAFSDEEWDRAEEIASDVAAKIVAEYGDIEVSGDIDCLRDAVENEDADVVRCMWERLTDYHGLSESSEQLAPFSAGVARVCGAEVLGDGSILFA